MLLPGKILSKILFGVVILTKPGSFEVDSVWKEVHLEDIITRTSSESDLRLNQRANALGDQKTVKPSEKRRLLK